MNKYCGKNLDGYVPIEASLQSINGVYGTKNLYCRWHAIKITDKEMKINFTKIIPDLNDMYAMEVKFSDGRTVINGLSEQNTVISGNLISEVYFHYFTTNTKYNQPFYADFYYPDDSNFNYLGLFIALGVIVLVCIICSIFFYKCSRVIIENANRRLQERRARVALEVLQVENRVDPQQVRNEEVRKENLHLLQNLFDSELRPFIFIKIEKDYPNSNCTICIEDFKTESVVVQLHCKHIFHSNCLRDWLSKSLLHPKCPNCNLNILPKVEEDINNSLININSRNQIINMHSPERQTTNELENISIHNTLRGRRQSQRNQMEINQQRETNTTQNNVNEINERNAKIHNQFVNMNVINLRNVSTSNQRRRMYSNAVLNNFINNNIDNQNLTPQNNQNPESNQPQNNNAQNANSENTNRNTNRN